MDLILLDPDDAKYVGHRTFEFLKKQQRRSIIPLLSWSNLFEVIINFLIYAQMNGLSKEDCQEAFDFIDSAPKVPEFLIYRLIKRYYLAIFDRDEEKRKLYATILREDNFKIVLQDEN